MSWDAKNFKMPAEAELRKKLSDEQFRVTQNEATERPFKNEFWDSKRDGIYVDVVSGEPLFASVHKYDSGTGWPSFFDTIAKENIVEKKDRKLFVTRTEIRSKHADSHLGHVFDDGPQPTGLRYCMNSASLRFVPVASLEKEGYGEYKKLFAGGAAETKVKAATAGSCADGQPCLVETPKAAVKKSEK